MSLGTKDIIEKLTPAVYTVKGVPDLCGVERESARIAVTGNVISQSNAQNLLNLMKVFGMASKRHNYDIVQIIQTLLGIIG